MLFLIYVQDFLFFGMSCRSIMIVEKLQLLVERKKSKENPPTIIVFLYTQRLVAEVDLDDITSYLYYCNIHSNAKVDN